MKVGFIIKELTTELRDFFSFLDLQKNVISKDVIYDGEDPVTSILRKSRSYNKLWFEGIHETFRYLLENVDNLEDLPKCTLRLQEDEIDVLKGLMDKNPSQAKLLTDLVVRTGDAKDKLHDYFGHDVNIHVIPSSYKMDVGCVFPMTEWAGIRSVVASTPIAAYKEPLKFEQHVELLNVANLCSGPTYTKGITYIVGDHPYLLRQYLTKAAGCTLANFIDAANNILIWEVKNKVEVVNKVRDLASSGKATVMVKMAANEQGNWVQLIKDVLPPFHQIEQYPRFVKIINLKKVEDTEEQVLEKDKVSVVIPTYNNESSIETAITCVRNQTYRNIEIVVVDDGSTDNTEGAVRALMELDSRIVYKKIPHSGRPIARNTGLALASADIIAWLDADDEALPGWLSTQVPAMKFYDVCFSAAIYANQAGAASSLRVYRDISQENFPKLLFTGLGGICPLLQSSTVVKRKVYDAVGRFDPEFPRCEDYDIWVRSAIHGGFTFGYCNIPLAIIRQNPPSEKVVREALKYYTALANKLIEAFPKDKLIRKYHKVLEISEEIEVAWTLLSICMLYKANQGHALVSEINMLIDVIMSKGNRLDFFECQHMRNLIYKSLEK